MLWDVETAAKQLHTDTPTILGWIERGIMPAPIVVGGKDGLVRWPAATLGEWAAAGCPTCEPPKQHECRRIKLAQFGEYVSRFAVHDVEADEEADVDADE